MESNISELVGKTLIRCDGEKGGAAFIFVTSTGEIYRMAHLQDCCESVLVEDICGDLNDLIGTPILSAYESHNADPMPVKDTSGCDSFTWTFYTIATIKGTVVIRWFGESNGFYSEEVDFIREA